MADGTGIAFTANSVEMMLMGTGVLEARPGDQMVITLLEGSGLVSADDQDQYLGAGYAVNVPLGGEGGLEAVGPPSEPVSISSDALSVGCSLVGIGCSSDDIVAVSAEEAKTLVDAALGAPTGFTSDAAGSDDALSDDTVGDGVVGSDTGGGGGGGSGGDDFPGQGWGEGEGGGKDHKDNPGKGNK
jgi:hypothetical protein